MRIYKSIRNIFVALVSAGVVALTAPTLCAPGSIIVPKKQYSFEEKLEEIGKAYDQKGINHLSFWDKEFNYFLARKHLDDDNVKDFILIIGTRTEKNPLKAEYPSGFDAIYIEDRSKDTGLGTVDTHLFYVDNGDFKDIWRIDRARLEETIRNYNLLKKINLSKKIDDPTAEETMRNVERGIIMETQQLKDANEDYRDAIDFMCKGKFN